MILFGQPIFLYLKILENDAFSKKTEKNAKNIVENL